MSNCSGEKRLHERIYFGKHMPVECMCSVDNTDSNRIFGFILNLSEGGINFIQERQGRRKIQKGDRIILKTVKGHDPLNFNQDIEMQVKWVLDHNEFPRNIGYGCMFLNLPQDKAELIRLMVADYVLDARENLKPFEGSAHATSSSESVN